MSLKPVKLSLVLSPIKQRTLSQSGNLYSVGIAACCGEGVHCEQNVRNAVLLYEINGVQREKAHVAYIDLLKAVHIKGYFRIAVAVLEHKQLSAVINVGVYSDYLSIRTHKYAVCAASVLILLEEGISQLILVVSVIIIC